MDKPASYLALSHVGGHCGCVKVRGKRPTKKSPLSVRVHQSAREALIRLSLADNRSQGEIVERLLLDEWRRRVEKAA